MKGFWTLEGSGVDQALSLCNVEMTVESKMETVKNGFGKTI